MAGIILILSDFIVSFMWVWSGVIVKLFVYKILGLRGLESEIIRLSLSISNMFFFACLGKITKGASYNPLSVFSGSISRGFSAFLFAIGARIPAQVFGSIAGVKLIIETFPEIRHGPRLNVDIPRGALTEGLLTFTIVTVSLGLTRKINDSFFMKTWISSLSKLTLHILGSDLTGGCMNPASAMAWAYSQGKHITKEHLMVYWLAPIEATLLAVWTFRRVTQPLKQNVNEKTKSD